MTGIKVGIARLLLAAPVAKLIRRGVRGSVRSYDLTFDTSNPAMSDRTVASVFFRLYESAEIRSVRSHLLATDTIIDLGSNLGITASHALRHLNAGGRLFSVEANPHLLAALRANLERHAFGRKISVVHAAVDYSGNSEVHMNIASDSLGSSVVRTGGATTVTVPTVTLSDLLDRHGVGDFTLLSDIEGAEAELVRHDGEALRRCHQAVLELHDTESATVDAVHVELEALGFRTVHRHGPVVVLRRDEA